MNLGIDATNIGGGGGITHLKEILQFVPDLSNGDLKIIVFASEKVLAQLPDHSLIVKQSFPALNKGVIHRLFFQLFSFDKYLNKECDVLFSVTGDYLGRFKPVVGMSRNMLLYERKIWREINQPKEILRFWINYLKQKRCFKNASGIIFISNYAKEFISSKLNLKDKEISIIHHGISPRFELESRPCLPISNYSLNVPFKFLYVSTVHIYKHQWNVVAAIDQLRKKGYPVSLDLVGESIFEPAEKLLLKAIDSFDPEGKFIHWHGHIPYDSIDYYYRSSDGIVYASTCENMPNILIESMASGLPIACSDKNPMPEFLKENGFYFDAKRVDSIACALERLLLSEKERESMIKYNKGEVVQYNWRITSQKTFEFILKHSKN
jgi:glycosyltransferase involved in cell wall biosynthesis